MLLIGDAAHGTSPHCGQGGAQAIEDGVVLADEVGKGLPVEQVLDHFMRRRYERCRTIVEGSERIGRWEQDPFPGHRPRRLGIRGHDGRDGPAVRHTSGETEVRTVDVHAHLGVPAVDELIADEPSLARQRALDAAGLGPASAAHNVEQIRSLAVRLTDVDTRLDAMDRAGVDVQAVSAVPLPHNWAGRDLAERIVALTNEAIAGFCAVRPDRFVGIGTVSLQHPDLAVRQLRTALADLHLRGVQISTAAAPGVELDDPSLAEFWAVAQESGAAVLIHPWGCSLGERLNAYYLFNTVGNPVETALALSRIAFSGLLERHPRLKIWAAHGGGYLPTYLGRADHAWAVRGDARTTAQPPSAQLRRVFVDSLVYTPQALRHLVENLGASQVTLGSDYPFDMGVEDPVERLLAAGFDDATVAAIRGGNAERLLGPLPHDRDPR